jgi:hypothetical protein
MITEPKRVSCLLRNLKKVSIFATNSKLFLGLVANLRNFKKSFPDRDKNFERVLGFYETFLRVSISLQKWFGMAPFFQCADHFGLVSLLLRQPYLGTVVAHGKITCNEIEKKDFDRVVKPVLDLIQHKYEQYKSLIDSPI